MAGQDIWENMPSKPDFINKLRCHMKEEICAYRMMHKKTKFFPARHLHLPFISYICYG